MALRTSLVHRIPLRRTHLAALGSLLVWALGCGPPAADLAITHVTVIDPASETVRPGQTVVVAEGMIRSVFASSPEEEPAASVVIDGSGKYLIPGLWDMHTHLDAHTDTDLSMLVVHGVLNVRDMGGDPFFLADLKDRIASGELMGPTVRGAGAILEDRAWLARARTVFPGLEHRVPVDNPEEARAVIAMLGSWGVDLVKVRNVTDRATLRAILAAAEVEGLTVAGHEPMIVDIDEAATLGMTTFEHVPFVTLTMPGKEADDDRIAAAIESLRTSGAFLDPTLIASNNLGKPREEIGAAIEAPDPRYQYLPASVKEAWLESLEGDAGPLPWGPMRERSLEIILRMHEAGIPLLAGTDMGVPLTFPGSSLHTELRLMVEQIGLEPMSALRAATSAPASLFGLAEGSIAPGMAANLVLLEEDPLDSITHTRSIEAVVLRGELLDRSRLDSLLEHVRENKDAVRSPSAFERLETSCLADETAECLEELAGYQFSRLLYAEARSTYQRALDAGAGDVALEGLFSSTVNALHEGDMECTEAATPVAELIAAHPNEPNKAVGVLDRVLSALGPECGEEQARYLSSLAEHEAVALSDEMQAIYHEHYASFLLKVEGDGDAAFEHRLSHMPSGWEENPLEIQQLAAWCLEQEVALSRARELAQRAAEVTDVPITRLMSKMLEARIASAQGDHEDAVALMEMIDRAVPNSSTVTGLLESFRELAGDETGDA